jgi:hypothetical protein
MIDDSVFEAAWKQMKDFQIPQVQSGFFGDNSAMHRAFMATDLMKSGLKSVHLHGEAPGMLSLPRYAESGYVIPYCRPDGSWVTDAAGNLAMYRTRLKIPEHSRESRYTQPSGEQLAKNGLPPFMPYIHPLTLKLEGEVMVCAEGEKKTVSVLRYLGLPAFGIGGCQMWRNPDGSGGVHPWIKQLLERKGINRVLIVPDGDLFKYDICNAYGTYAHTLRASGIQVEICNPPDKIDDLLVQWGESALANFDALPKVSLDELVQSPSLLVRRYNLAFKQNDKGVVTVHQTTSNVMKLLEEHPAFPKIWRNNDNNRVYIGEEQASPDLTEMNIANYFQHNLGFEKVGHKMVYSCIQALSKQNQRSPMLDWIKSLEWDGVQRLDNWIADYWRVENSDYLKEVSSKWLISACARMDKPGTKVDWMLIIVGPQGIGKTSMPSVIFNGNSLTLYGESNDKDLHMKIHSALVIGFDELDSFGKKESSFLKAMITTSQDHFRPPYGASVEVFDRRCTLYGCGNRHEFLQADPSGYRRYAIVEVGQKLDFAGLEAARTQLWAEAWARYSGGSDYWEVVGASAEAEKFVAPSELEEQIFEFIQALRNSPLFHKNGFMYTKYGTVVKSIQTQRPNPREVAAILRKFGGEKKVNDRGPQGGSPTDWWVFPIDGSQ